MTLTSYLMEELQPPMRIPSVEPREGWVAASSPMQGAGGVTAVGVLRTLKNGRRCADGALGQESCYLGSALRLEAGLCCRRGRVSDFPQSRTTWVSTSGRATVYTLLGCQSPVLATRSGSSDRNSIISTSFYFRKYLKWAISNHFKLYFTLLQ